MQLKWKYKDHHTTAWSFEGVHLCNYTLYHKNYQDRFQTLRMHMHTNSARNWGGSFPWKNRAYHFPKGVKLHVETKTKSSWENSGPRNELKKGGEENWNISSWREKYLALDDLSMKKRFHWSGLQLLPCPPTNYNNHSNQIYKTKSTNTVKRELGPTINLLKTLHLIHRDNEKCHKHTLLLSLSTF
jgi:hypothetical protein